MLSNEVLLLLFFYDYSISYARQLKNREIWSYYVWRAYNLHLSVTQLSNETSIRASRLLQFKKEGLLVFNIHIHMLKNVGNFRRATFNFVFLLKKRKKKHSIINLPVSFSEATPVNKISIFLCEREFTCSNRQNWILQLTADVFHLNKSGCTKEMAGLL